MKYKDMDLTQRLFLVELDSMIESTEEFIGDDNITPENDPDGRLKDLEALNYVRELWSHWYLDEDDPTFGRLER